MRAGRKQFQEKRCNCIAGFGLGHMIMTVIIIIIIICNFRVL